MGIRKLAASLPKWMELAKRPRHDLALAATLMERAGTGGSLFRNFYRDFLTEALEVVGRKPALVEARDSFAATAEAWAGVAASVMESGRSGSAVPLEAASAACLRIADLEMAAMRKLAAA
jgi:hypothetical protein